MGSPQQASPRGLLAAGAVHWACEKDAGQLKRLF
jgi:hypothetical protein